MTDAIGYAAAALGTLVMLPQVLKTIRTQSAHDVSAVMLGTYLVQNVLWGLYGTLIDSVPLIVCNVVAFGLCSTQAVLKVRYNHLAADGMLGAAAHLSRHHPGPGVGLEERQEADEGG